jgi:hypothetical protein
MILEISNINRENEKNCIYDKFLIFDILNRIEVKFEENNAPIIGKYLYIQSGDVIPIFSYPIRMF